MNVVDCRSVPWIACLAVFLFSGVAVAQDGSTPRTAGDDPVLDQKPLSQWLKQLRSENRGLQMRATKALSAAPANLHAQIIPQVIPVLKSERENDKFVAAQVLGEYGPKSKAAVPDLLPMLEGTQYERNRAAAAKALGQILKDSPPSAEIKEITQLLIAKFGDKYSDVRREAVRACGMIGPAAKACLPHVPPLMQEFHLGYALYEGYPVRCDAAWAVGRMGKDAAVHIDLLISLLHSDGHVNPNLVWAIGQVGPVHANVIPNIIDKIESTGRGGDGGSLKVPAFAVLASFGEKSAAVVPVIRRMLQGPMYGNDAMVIRIAMMKALPAFGAAAKEAAPEILAQIRIADGQDEQSKTLKEEASKAYKAVTGQEPPAKK